MDGRRRRVRAGAVCSVIPRAGCGAAAGLAALRCVRLAAIEVCCLSRGAFVGELALERRAVLAGVFLGSVRALAGGLGALLGAGGAVVGFVGEFVASLDVCCGSTQPHDTPVRADPRELALARFALPGVRLSLSGLAPRTSGDRVVTEIRCSSASWSPHPSTAGVQPGHEGAQFNLPQMYWRVRPCFWSRWWNLGFTGTPMVIVRRSRPMTRSRCAGRGAGSTTGSSIWMSRSSWCHRHTANAFMR